MKKQTGTVSNILRILARHVVRGIFMVAAAGGIALAADDVGVLPNPSAALEPPAATPLPSPKGMTGFSANAPQMAAPTTSGVTPATLPGTDNPSAVPQTPPAAAPAAPLGVPDMNPGSPPSAMPPASAAPAAAASLYTGSAPDSQARDITTTGVGAGSSVAEQVAAQRARADAPNAFGNTDTSRAAFTQMLRNLMPLSPSQIVTLRGLFDKTQQAVATYPGTPPKPTSSSIMVNMSPGATPPVIRLRDGYVTSMVFLDSTGQPWPVTGYDLGNPKAFNIQPSAPDGKSNTLLIQAMDRYQQGNLAIMLKGENTPVMLTLMPGQRAVDYRVDLRIPGLGPNAVVVSNSLPQAEDPILLNFLDGTPPQDAQLLQVDGAPAQAWSFQGFLYLRARFTILSPGWIATMSSPDGTHVYELPKTPVLLASHRGEMVRLSIKGLDAHE